jgi:hypothetical protein
MHWKVEHIVSAPRSLVERVVLSPSTTSVLPRYMPGIARATVLSREERGALLVVRKRFEPSITLPSFAKGVRPDMTQWVETVTWDRSKHEAHFAIDANVPDEWKRHFSAEGIYRLEDRGPVTMRVIEGEISVRVPLMGGLAERYIVGVMRDVFDGEARGLNACVAESVAA